MIQVRTPAGRSNYKALAVKVDKRFSHRFLVQDQLAEIGIAPRHAPLLTTLKPGSVRVQTAEGECASVNRMPCAASRSIFGVGILPRCGLKHCTTP